MPRTSKYTRIANYINTRLTEVIMNPTIEDKSSNTYKSFRYCFNLQDGIEICVTVDIHPKRKALFMFCNAYKDGINIPNDGNNMYYGRVGDWNIDDITLNKLLDSFKKRVTYIKQEAK